MSNILQIFHDARKLNSLCASLVFWTGLVLLGLLLASFTWSLFAPRPLLESVSVDSSHSSDQLTGERYSVLDIVNSLHRFNAWENAPAVLPTPVVSDVKPKAVPSTLDLILIGTLVLPEQEKSRAVLTRKLNEQQQLFLAVGDKVDGAVLTRVERNSVYFRRDGKHEIITMELPDVLARSDMGVGSVESGHGSRQATDLNIARSRFEALVAQGPNLLKGVSISPYYRGSSSVGYQLDFSGNNASFAEFGVQSGDVIEKVNDVAVTNSTEMSKLLREIKQSGSIDIDLLRDGSPRRVKIGIGDSTDSGLYRP